MRKSYFLITTLIFVIILAIISSPEIYISAFSRGLETWAKILLPTLFPLIFFTKLLGDLGCISALSNKFSLTQKLFKAPAVSSYAFLVSILSGYPVGAKVVADMVDDGYISRRDAIKICTFTSNSGPMFIYGSVGVGMLFSRTLGLIMLLSHILSAICNGLFYRSFSPSAPTNSLNLQKKPEFSLSKSMTDSLLSILLIGGFVSVFFVVIELLNQTQIFTILASFIAGIFNTDPNLFIGIFNGLIEMTHGCLDISTLPLSPKIIAIICTALITFGGIATMLQAFAFLQKIGISLKFFITQKITQTIFATAICSLLVLIF